MGTPLTVITPDSVSRGFWGNCPARMLSRVVFPAITGGCPGFTPFDDDPDCQPVGKRRCVMATLLRGAESIQRLDVVVTTWL